MSKRKFQYGPFPRSLRELIQPTLKAGQKGHGFADSRLLTDWGKIVGPELAQYCLPMHISVPRGAKAGDPTLTLRVTPGFATIIQHKEPQILERIAGYFGYRVAARIAMVQAPLPVPQPGYKPVAMPTRKPSADLLRTIASVQDDSVKSALQSLGLALSQRKG